MKRKIALFFVLLLSLSTFYGQITVSDILNSDTLTLGKAFDYIETHPEVKLSTDTLTMKRYNRILYYYESKLDSDGTLKEFVRTIQKNINHSSELYSLPTGSSIGGNNWQELGPFEANISPNSYFGIGRVLCIAKDPTPGITIYYIGTPNSGLWKTDNLDGNNTHWECLTKDFSNIGVYSIAINPDNPNIIYIASSVFV